MCAWAVAIRNPHSTSAGAAAMPACWNCARSATYLRAETLLPLTGFLPQKDVRKRLREIAPTRRVDRYAVRIVARDA